MASTFSFFDPRRSADSFSSDTNSPPNFRKNSQINFKNPLMIFNGKNKESRGWSPTDSSNTHQDDSTLFSKSSTVPISWIDTSVPSPSSKPLSASVGSTSPLFMPRYHTEFERICKIGKGGFGDVFKVRNTLDGCLYAIKRIKLGNDKAKNARFLREVSALSRLSHSNIVRYYQAWIEAGSDNESDEEDFDESDEDDDNSHTNLNHRQDESYDRLAFSEEEDNSYLNVPFDLDLGTTQTSPKENLLSCDLCKKVYKDWEVPKQDWFRLDSRTQSFNLCRDCYSDEVRRGGFKNSPSAISSLPMTQYLYIQMEYCERTLRAELDHKSIWKTKTDDGIWLLFRQIVEATNYIHSNSCIHRDLKPSNIFLTYDGNVKLGDFGLATGDVIVREASNSIKRRGPSQALKCNSFLNMPKVSPKGQERTTDIGTMLYRAPELEESLEYDEKVDIFSLGIILFELWHPFNTGMERVEVLETLRHKHQLPPSFVQKYQFQSRLILNLTDNNPKNRFSASSLLEAVPFY